MEEKQVDTSKKVNLIFPGLLSLAVGLMFAVPGVFFSKKIISQLLQNKLPDGIFVFVTVLIVAIGIILLLLAYRFFTGKVDNQRLSITILTIASLFFISISSLIAVETYVLKWMEPTGQTGRAIGGGFTAGCLGLYFAFKRRRSPSRPNKINPQKRTDDI